MSHLLLRRLRGLHKDDRGTSLTELVVGMTVMGIFMAIFTASVVSLARTATKVEAVTTSAAQLNNAFLKLDKMVRYANAITTVGKSTGTSGDWYVELYNVDSDTDVATCTQLRVDVTAQQLQLRTWTVLSPTTYSSLSPTWIPLASNLTNASAAAGSADQPFSAPAPLAAATSRFQQLTVTLVAATSGPSSTTTRTRIGFTVLNSSAQDKSNTSKCQQTLTTGLRP